MISTPGDAPPKFDVYARPFVPQALKDVNEAPANVITCTPARWIDCNRYTSTFAGTDFFDAAGPQLSLDSSIPSGANPSNGATSHVNSSASSYSTPDLSREDQRDRRPLLPHNYHEHFRAALITEAACQQAECDDHALFRVAVARADRNIDPRPSIWILNVPGLREFSLRIEVGDIVQLRQIRFDAQGQIVSGSILKDQYGKPLALPHGHDYQHDAVVWGIDRLRETLSLRIDKLTPRSMLFNVRFTTQSVRFQAMYNAVITAQKALAAKDGWMRSMLFPQLSDGHYQKTLNRRDHDLELHDSLLNYEQSRAVDTVVNELYGPVPFIISGPPGTGKTKTMVELSLQLIAMRERAHLLICAPSDPAADTLIQRLNKHLQPSHLLRINSPARNFPEVPTTVLPYCHVDDGLFSLPTFKELMQKRIVITTCRDADILVRARVTNVDLCRLERELHRTMHPSAAITPPQLHWTGLLIDEAAQAMEPEALVPMTIVAPPENHGMLDKDLPVLVLAGDQHQLGPRSASRTLDVRTSLFERLLSRPFYAEHPLARSRQTGGVMRPLTQDMLPILRPAFANLIRNYRSHPAILATPSRLFYNDTLEPQASGTDALQQWPGWHGRGWPVLFSCNTAPDEIEQDGGGWYNNEEARMACHYAASFIQSGLVEANEICIMSPFRAQVRVLRKLARAPAFAMPGLNIGPLEAFQGLEKRVIIICTTRTRDRFLDQDLAKGLGVIHEPKRFNVALTRAMHSLVVIGNPFLLDKDEHWTAFLGFCERNGLWEDQTGSCAAWRGERLAMKDRTSRLEKQMIRKEEGEGEINGLSSGVRRLGVARDAEHDLWRSGVEAELMVGTEREEEEQ